MICAPTHLPFVKQNKMPDALSLLFLIEENAATKNSHRPKLTVCGNFIYIGRRRSEGRLPPGERVTMKLC